MAVNPAAILGLIGGGLGAMSSGLNFLGSYANYKYQKRLQNHQYGLNIKGLKESPLAQRQGLEAAGFNPMLTYMNQSNATVSPAGSPASSSIGSDLVAGLEKASNFRLANAQAYKLEKEAENIGNTPQDMILNAIKGYIGAEGLSNNDLSSMLGSKLKNLNPNLKEKLLNFSKNLRGSLPDENTNANTFKTGIQHNEYINTNASKINIPKFTPLEKRQIMDLEREVRSKKRSNYKAPPSKGALDLIYKDYR